MNIIETPRLTLRAWTNDDVAAAFRLYGDPEVTRWLGSGAFEESMETQAANLKKVIAKYQDLGQAGYGFWAAESKADGEVLGAGLLKPLALSEGADPLPEPEVEIGWHLAKPFWGQGYGTEIGRAMVQQAFEVVGLDSVFAIAYPDNVRSTHIMEKLGMARLGLTDRYYGIPDIVVYRLDRSLKQMGTSGV